MKLGLFQRFFRVKKSPVIEQQPIREDIPSTHIDRRQNATRIRGLRRPITRDPDRDLEPIKQCRMRQISQYLYRSNPIAKRGVQNLCSFVTSEGFKVRATSQNEEARKKFQSWLDRWWKKNHWEKKLSKRYRTLSVEGEWLYWRAPADAFGISKLCLILPENIRHVERCPLDAERLSRVSLRLPLEFQVGEAKYSKQHLRLADDENLDGEALLFQANTLSGQTRGVSDLLVVCDWLDQLDTVLYTEVERVQFQRAYSWFVKVSSTDPNGELSPEASEQKLQKTKEAIQEAGPPTPGSILVHDETESWDVKAPELHLEDSVKFIQLLMHLCFGGLYMPEHYFATGGDVNKATSSNMDTPIFAVVRDRKQDLQAFFALAIALDVRQAKRMGVLAGIDDEDLTFEVVSRDPDRSSYDLIGAMLKSLGEALQLGKAEGWFSDEEAARAFRTAASGLGLGEFPPLDKDSLQQARAEVTTKLEQMKPELEKVFPTAIGTTREACLHEVDTPEESKKKALAYRDELAREVNSRWGIMERDTHTARVYAERMSKLAAQELRSTSTTEIDLDKIRKSVRDIQEIFREDYPTTLLSGTVDSGRRYVDKALAPFGLSVPPKDLTFGRDTWSLERRVAFSTVKEPPQGSKQSRRTLGQEVNYASSWWASKDFGDRILAKAEEAKAKGMTLQQFVGGLQTDPRIEGSLARETADSISDMAEHALLRAGRFAEDLTWADYDQANPGRIKQRYLRVKVGSGPCSVCEPSSGKVYSVGKGPRLPRHKRCGCLYAPMVDDREPFGKFSNEIWGDDGGLPELVGKAFEKSLFAYEAVDKAKIYSVSDGYLASHVLQPAPVVERLSFEGTQKEYWDFCFKQGLPGAVAGVGDLVAYDKAGVRYIEHFRKDEDWRERLDLLPLAFSTLDAPDHLAYNLSNKNWNLHKRVSPGVGQDPIIIKVILKQSPQGWYPLTWFNASSEPLDELNSKLVKHGGKWLL